MFSIGLALVTLSTLAVGYQWWLLCSDFARLMYQGGRETACSGRSRDRRRGSGETYLIKMRAAFFELDPGLRAKN